MMTWAAIPCFLCLAFLLHAPQAAEGRPPRFGQCTMHVHIEAGKKHFHAIEHVVHTQDPLTDVILLDIQLLKEIQSSERCCFLRELLKFYLDKVFRPHEATLTSIRGEITSLADTFISMKQQLEHCNQSEHRHCHCREQAKSTMDIIKENFEKLDTKTAAFKAIGELNILFHWIKSHFGNHKQP